MLTDPKQEPRLLLVDDQDANVRMLEQLLNRAGYSRVFSTRDSRQTVPMFLELDPDIVLLDLHMPHMDGYAVLAALKQVTPLEAFLPILVLTADAMPAAKQQALSLGATDFVNKPFDAVEVLLRIRNLLHARFLYLDLAQHARSLGERVQARTAELQQAQVEMLERLCTASEARDDDTGDHTKRVGRLAGALGLRAGWPPEKIEELRRAASLHDIGKIAIPDNILLKPGRLDPTEFATMKTHTAVGARILAGSRFSTLQLAEQIAQYHHERWDGNGYYSLSAEAIPFSARIVAVVDVFDVLTHSRPYKKAWSADEALALIRREAGKHFDPRLAATFIQMIATSDLAALSSAVAHESVVPQLV